MSNRCTSPLVEKRKSRVRRDLSLALDELPQKPWHPKKSSGVPDMSVTRKLDIPQGVSGSSSCRFRGSPPSSPTKTTGMEDFLTPQSPDRIHLWNNKKTFASGPSRSAPSSPVNSVQCSPNLRKKLLGNSEMSFRAKELLGDSQVFEQIECGSPTIYEDVNCEENGTSQIPSGSLRTSFLLKNKCDSSPAIALTCSTPFGQDKQFVWSRKVTGGRSNSNSSPISKFANQWKSKIFPEAREKAKETFCVSDSQFDDCDIEYSVGLTESHSLGHPQKNLGSMDMLSHPKKSYSLINRSQSMKSSDDYAQHDEKGVLSPNKDMSFFSKLRSSFRKKWWVQTFYFDSSMRLIKFIF